MESWISGCYGKISSQSDGWRGIYWLDANIRRSICGYAGIFDANTESEDSIWLILSRSAKFFVKENGDSVLQNRGKLSDREILKIQRFIKKNYQEMFLKWSEYSKNGYYEK